MTHTDTNKRHDFLMIFDVTMGNPNGDPDADNLPRIDPETMHGIVTDVCLKRKIRDYFAAVLNRPIFIQSKIALNKLIHEGFKKAGYYPFETELTETEVENDSLMEWLRAQPEFDVVEEERGGEDLPFSKVVYGGEYGKTSKIKEQLLKGLGDDQKEIKSLIQEIGKRFKKTGDEKKQKGLDRKIQGAARDNLCAEYDDIRIFGAVLSTGLNAGQVRGPMQLTFARSVDPILPQSHTITRQARTTSARMETGQTEMGRKSAVPYGLYFARGFYNPFLGEQTGIKNDDLERFWEALTRMFEYDRSASRGEMIMHQVYIFTHEDKKGNAHAHLLFKLLTDEIQKKPEAIYPRTVGDYLPFPGKAEIKAKMAAQNINNVTVTLLNS
ncbi:conserved hypothetical protein [Syntrophobacter sp. SbD2]|nr:conserved hypothetical protein [Syntrophobacter sp. SbD2]